MNSQSATKHYLAGYGVGMVYDLAGSWRIMTEYKSDTVYPCGLSGKSLSLSRIDDRGREGKRVPHPYAYRNPFSNNNIRTKPTNNGLELP